MSVGIQMKLAGLGKASKKHADALWRAQICARWLGYGGRTVSMDDLRDEMERIGWNLDLGMAAGGVFDTEHWTLICWERSRREIRRAGLIGRWRLRANA